MAQRASSNDADAGSSTNELTFAHVLYYRNHSRRAIPETGNMTLGSKALSFQSTKGLHFKWDLECITFEQFRGRINRGFKVIGKRQTEGNADDEYSFTMVKGGDSAYNAIHSAIEEYKFQLEMEKIKLSSEKALSEMKDSGTSLPASLLATNDDGNVNKAHYFFMIPLHFIIATIIKVCLFAYKKATGKSLLLSKNIDDAIHNVSLKLCQILTVSKILQSNTRHLAVREEVNGIKQSLLKMKRIARRDCESFSQQGAVVDDTEQRRLMPIPDAVYLAYDKITYSLRFLFRKCSARLYRPEVFSFYQHPATVGEAVQYTSAKLVELTELANETLSKTAKLQMVEETKQIQLCLYNILILSSKETSTNPEKSSVKSS